MKKRIKLWWNHVLWKYSTPVRKIIDLESKRYLHYLNENYPNEKDQLTILRNLKEEYIVSLNDKIKNNEIQIIEKTENINFLKTLLTKTNTL